MTHVFQTTAYGKWILSGEHSVLRGSPALVFPLKSKSLKMRFEPLVSGLDVQMNNQSGGEFRMLFWSLLEKACTMARISIQSISGQISFVSDIPIGSGLGASASLCAAVARWFSFEKLISIESEYDFARELENIFHGESSGVDVAVVLSEQGLHFERNGIRKTLNPVWSPYWGISDSGQKGMTYDCVRQVKDLLQRDPVLGAAIDQRMIQATLLCEQSLLKSETTGFPELAVGIEQAGQCFQDWGLVTPQAQLLMDQLKAAGAMACKPTGSGGGGYVLSLWTKPWPSDLNSQIISCR